MPKPNVSDGADDVVVCEPYGGALIPNVNPLAVVAAVGRAVGAVAIDDGAATAPKVNGATDCCVGAVCCVFEAPNPKPVFAVVVCGAPNVNDIF